jgi:hypothetical protein
MAILVFWDRAASPMFLQQKYEAKIHNALVDVGWFDEWTNQFGENLPKFRLKTVNIQIYLYLKVQFIILES